jgi:small subunit ribosomal protein S1
VGAEAEGKIVRIIEKGVIVELPLGVDGFIPASQLSMTPVKNFTDSFHLGDTLPLKVIDFDKDSKKIVLSVVEYLRGKEQKLVDEYVSQHRLAPMTIKDVASVSPHEQKSAPPETATAKPTAEEEKPEASTPAQEQ